MPHSYTGLYGWQFHETPLWLDWDGLLKSIGNLIQNWVFYGGAESIRVCMQQLEDILHLIWSIGRNYENDQFPRLIRHRNVLEIFLCEITNKDTLFRHTWLSVLCFALRMFSRQARWNTRPLSVVILLSFFFNGLSHEQQVSMMSQSRNEKSIHVYIL
jgi:hypothetical protein